MGETLKQLYNAKDWATIDEGLWKQVFSIKVS